MQEKKIKIVHYLNQYFGGLGSEEKADTGPRIMEGAVGPGKAVQNMVGEQGRVVATVVCGDNYFAERIEQVAEEIIQLIAPLQPDALIAGPAFDAGRYGIACGAMCKTAHDRLGIPSVTGMNRANPGVDLYRKYTYIVETPGSVISMAEAVSKMVSILNRLVNKEKIGKPSEEGYLSRGLLSNEMSDYTGAVRAVSMLLDKLHGRPFETEIPLPQYERIDPAPGIPDIGSAVIALVTDGGLVPKGNPDKVESREASRFGVYGIEGMDRLRPDGYEVNHIGYDPVFVLQDPNRLVPVDVMTELEKEGVIGKLHKKMYCTSGAVCIVENMVKIGKAMAEKLKAAGVSGVILTST
jgi:betaine reductase